LGTTNLAENIFLLKLCGNVVPWKHNFEILKKKRKIGDLMKTTTRIGTRMSKSKLKTM